MNFHGNLIYRNKVVNLMRMVTGHSWGADRQSLNLYKAMIRLLVMEITISFTFFLIQHVLGPSETELKSLIKIEPMKGGKVNGNLTLKLNNTMKYKAKLEGKGSPHWVLTE